MPHHGSRQLHLSTDGSMEYLVMCVFADPASNDLTTIYSVVVDPQDNTFQKLSDYMLQIYLQTVAKIIQFINNMEAKGFAYFVTNNNNSMMSNLKRNEEKRNATTTKPPASDIILVNQEREQNATDSHDTCSSPPSLHPL